MSKINVGFIGYGSCKFYPPVVKKTKQLHPAIFEVSYIRSKTAY